jgi:UDP-N-acetylglucosamine--N-acetylmuramyl-(pentapeptide) pyrophosphoryl-undecaprenol N-acetylglucosamine transferase
VLASLDVAAVNVRHQCGAGHFESTQTRYAGSRADVEVVEFIDDMASAYTWASVVVCRAGALTVCELAAAGVASILVPFPHAVDDHQTANARFLVEANAGMLVAEGRDFEQRLRDALQRLCDDRAELRRFADNAKAMALPDAAGTVAARCVELLNG